jgi:Fe-S-cluster containining protein
MYASYNNTDGLKEAIHEMNSGYTCFCVDGKCSNCGECCTDMLPVSQRELQRIKQYVTKHHLKEHHSHFALVTTEPVVDYVCPFRNSLAKRCDIYEVRPEVCRSFICTKSEEQAHIDRDRITRNKKVCSMRWEVFQNPEVLMWIHNSYKIGLTMKQQK